MVNIFFNGLRPGNGILEKPHRRGTLVALHDRNVREPGPESGLLFMAVSDDRGVVEGEIPDFEGTKNIRVRIRDVGFKSITVEDTMAQGGYYRSVKLEKDESKDKSIIEQGFDDISEWENWDSDARFAAAQRDLVRNARIAGLEASQSGGTIVDATGRGAQTVPTPTQEARGPLFAEIGTAEENDEEQQITAEVHAEAPRASASASGNVTPDSGNSSLDLHFAPGPKIVTINESGEIDFVSLYSTIKRWEASADGIAYSQVAESDGNVELPDGTRTQRCMILKGGWRLSAVDPVSITGGYITGNNGETYNPVVEEALDRVHINGDVRRIEGRGALKASDSAVGGSGSVADTDKVELGDSASIEVTSAHSGDLEGEQGDHTPRSGADSGKVSIGRAIIIHRQEILKRAPALKEAAAEILAKYDKDRPNDEATQEFVDSLRQLSTGIDEYVLALKTAPSEAEAEGAGLSLFQKAMACIEALEKSGTGDKLSRLAVCTAVLGVIAISAPLITPYLSFPVITACVFHKETKGAVSLLKEVRSTLGQGLKKLLPGQNDHVEPDDL